MIGGVSITKLFLAGLVPGLIVALALALACGRQMSGETIVPPPRQSRGDLGRTLIDGVGVQMLPVIIIVGLKTGVFTPAESALVAAVYSPFVATCVYRELKVGELYGVFVAPPGPPPSSRFSSPRHGLVLADHGLRHRERPRHAS